MYPVKVECEFISTLQAFAKDVGVPAVLVCNGAKTQKKKEVKDFPTRLVQLFVFWRMKINGLIGMNFTLA